MWIFCGREYSLGLALRMLIYIATAAVVMFIEDSNYVHGSWRLGVGLLPAFPLVFTAIFVMRYYRTCDELQKRVISEGMLFAFGATAVASLSYGYLESVLELPYITAFSSWVVMGTAWCFGTIVAKRRYR